MNHQRLLLASALGLGLTLGVVILLGGPRPARAGPAAAVRYVTTTGRDFDGEFCVAVLVGGAWQEVGCLGYDQFPAEKSLNLAGLDFCGDVQIRVTHTGATAAHVDSALLDGQPPQAVVGAGEGAALALKKASARDYDVLDARGRTLVFTFDAQAPPATFALVARVEPEHISEIPFQFPLDNLYQEMSTDSAFYTYVWDSQSGSLEIDGDLAGENLGEPFFAEFSETGSGHPSGFTYGWVRNDSENLYVALDFTPDNTMDGGKDYAKVYVNTPAGLRAFKVSVPEQQWGAPGFAYTGRVVYQHKVYEFAIPLAEIGGAPASGAPLQLAFAAYGTAAPPLGHYPGPLDPSFGKGGIVNTSIGVWAKGRAVALQPDGKIVVAGSAQTVPYYTDFSLARYNADGTLDASFGINGIVTTPVSSMYDDGYAVDLQPDGKIVVAGASRQVSDYDFALARYTITGTLDASFGVGGIVTTTIGSDRDEGRAVAFHNGKIIVAGYSKRSSAGYDYALALARHTITGTLDTSFGVGGVVTTVIGSSSKGYATAVQPNGSILVAGEGYSNHDYHFALARYTITGTLDASFGVGGIVTTSIGGYSSARAIDLQPDGKIVVAGSSHQVSDYDYDFALARYTITGTLDTSFGAGGVVTTAFDSGSMDEVYAVAVQSDGKIVAVGSNLPHYFALARYNSDGSLDNTFGEDGRVNTRGFDASIAYGAVIQPDGKIVAAGEFYDGIALARYGTDLILHKTVTPAAVYPGQAITYTIVFSNNGAPMMDVQVLDSLPISVSVTRIVSAGVHVTMTHTGPDYVWDVGRLAYGPVGVITITGIVSRPLVAGAFTNTAVITPTTLDYFPPNNRHSAVLVVKLGRIYLPLVLRT